MLNTDFLVNINSAITLESVYTDGQTNLLWWACIHYPLSLVIYESGGPAHWQPYVSTFLHTQDRPINDFQIHHPKAQWTHQMNCWWYWQHLGFPAFHLPPRLNKHNCGLSSRERKSSTKQFWFSPKGAVAKHRQRNYPVRVIYQATWRNVEKEEITSGPKMAH